VTKESKEKAVVAAHRNFLSERGKSTCGGQEGVARKLSAQDSSDSMRPPEQPHASPRDSPRSLKGCEKGETRKRLRSKRCLFSRSIQRHRYKSQEPSEGAEEKKEKYPEG